MATRGPRKKKKKASGTDLAGGLSCSWRLQTVASPNFSAERKVFLHCKAPETARARWQQPPTCFWIFFPKIYLKMAGHLAPCFYLHVMTVISCLNGGRRQSAVFFSFIFKTLSRSRKVETHKGGGGGAGGWLRDHQGRQVGASAWLSIASQRRDV